MKTLIKFQMQSWLYNKAVWLTLIVWLIINSFAINQRSFEVKTAALDKDSSGAYQAQKEKAYYTLLDSAERNLKQFEDYYYDPRNPAQFNSVPRFAYFKPGTLNLFANGQSDLLPQQYNIASRTDLMQQKEPAINGVQVLYGKLDVAFIIVFLLPVIVIAFNYNILSAEKESGTLKILLAQNASLRQVISSKLLVSFLFMLLLLLIPVAGIWFAGINPLHILSSVGLYLVTGILYSLFWHLLCGFINTKLKSSAYNATLSLGCWLLLVFIFPAAVSLLTDAIHPVPSRANFVTNYRKVLNDVESQDVNHVLDKYFFDHPELAVQDTGTGEKNTSNVFYKAYHITNEKTAEQLQPLYNDYAVKLKSANNFSNIAGLLSPAVITQQCLVLLAGQSSKQYLHFTHQIAAWRKPYLHYILANIIENKRVVKTETLKYRAFDYPPYNYTKGLWLNIIVLFVMVMVLAAFTQRLLKKTTII